MLEKHRLTYLDALGIENYMPRYVLPNAQPSQLLSDDALREPAAFSTADVDDLSPSAPALLPDEPSAQLPKPIAPVADELMQSLGIKPASDEPKKASLQPEALARSDTAAVADISAQPQSIVKEPVSVDTAVSAVAQGVRFSLNVWRIRDELIVIDSRQPASALPTDKLLQNILRSIGYPLVQLPKSELLRWPLFSQQATRKKMAGIVEQTSEVDEARAMVQAYVSAQYSKAPVKALLLLGQHAAQFALAPKNTPASNDSGELSAIDFYEAHKGSVVSSTWEHHNSHVIVAPSLVDMLNDPMQKRIMWQALQVLLTPSTPS
ncbi:hypothetical protein ACVBE9_09935 [Eionea flava]